MKKLSFNNEATVRQIFIFILGVVSGMCFVYGLVRSNSFEDISLITKPYSSGSGNKQPIGKDEPVEKTFNDTPTNSLFNSVKILCLINTSKQQIQNRAIHVEATWAKRCNKHVFLSSHENFTLPFLELGVPEVRAKLWTKMKKMLRWVFENEIDNYDFFLKADDDSYFIMENLRFMLLPYNPDKALYFGARYRVIVKDGFMSGGAGYILSREAVKQLVPVLDNPEFCEQEDGEIEDVRVGGCAEKLNFTFVDTRDHLGRHRMLPQYPGDHFMNGLNRAQLDYLYYPYPQNQTTDCCAVYMISFHYVENVMMHVIDSMLYRTKVLEPMDQMWINALKMTDGKSMSVIEGLRQASKNYSYH